MQGNTFGSMRWGNSRSRNIWSIGALVLLVLVATTAPAAEPVNVAAELSRIQTEYNQAVQGTSRLSPAFRQASAARRAALEKLVSAAAEAQSTEHAPLAQAYQLLGRSEETIRHARAALAENAQDVAIHQALVQALSNQQQFDDAEQALAAARQKFPDNLAIAALESTLGFGYYRAQKFDQACTHLAAHLDFLGTQIQQSPVLIASFQNTAGTLAAMASQHGQAAMALPVIERHLQQLSAAMARQPALAGQVGKLQLQKVELLYALKRSDEARQLLDQQLTSAQTALAAEPENTAAVQAVADVLRRKMIDSGLEEATEANIAAYTGFIQAQLPRQASNAAFLNVATGTMRQLAERLAKQNKAPEAEKLATDWLEQLGALKSTDQPNPALDAAIRTANLALDALQEDLALAALVGKPYFPIKNATWLNGAPLSAEDLRGKVVLLDFWAVWCGPCIACFPHLRHLQEEYGDKGLVIIGVTRRYQFDWDDKAKAIDRVEELPPEKEDLATAAFLKHHELKHRIAVMQDNNLSQQYHVSGIPHAVVIDQQGQICLTRVGSGESNARDLEAEIRRLLGLKPAAERNAAP